MAIDLGKSAVSIGVGTLDEVMEWWDEEQARAGSFRTATDISRLVVVGLGYGAQVFMPRYAKLGETVALSATPLLVKTISRAIRRPQVAASASGMRRATSFSPKAMTGAYMPPEATPQLF